MGNTIVQCESTLKPSRIEVSLGYLICWIKIISMSSLLSLQTLFLTPFNKKYFWTPIDSLYCGINSFRQNESLNQNKLSINMYLEPELMWQKSMTYRICAGQSISVEQSCTKHKLTA